MIKLSEQAYQQLLSDQLAKIEGEEIIAELKRENLLLKVAVMELRDTLNTIEGKLIKAFYDDNTSFWDALVDIRKTIKKDSTNGKE